MITLTAPASSNARGMDAVDEPADLLPEYNG
jgi:hypothetical protein